MLADKHPKLVLSSMVERFTWTRPLSWNVPGFPEIDRGTMQDRLHSGLAYILQLFPAARSAVSHVISQKFPFPEASKVLPRSELLGTVRQR